MARLTIAILAFVSLLPALGPAQPLRFDPALSNGANLGGSGTWTAAATANWFNGTTDVAWNNTGVAEFTGTGGGTAPFTVTIAAAGVSADGLTFSTDGYTVTGGNLTLINAGTVTVATGVTGTVSSAIGGTAPLAKSGTGTLVLSGANTYTGATNVTAGALAVQNISALGTTAGTTTVSSGAALRIDGSGLNIAEPLSIAGTGITNTGAVRNLANNNTLSGPITLTANARINSDAGTLTISGGISAPIIGFVTVGGAGNTTISGPITGTGGVSKVDAGTLTLSSPANAYSGSTVINAGTLALGHAAAIPFGPGKGNVILNAGAGGTLDLAGFSPTFNILQGTASPGTVGRVHNSVPSTTSVMTVGNSDDISNTFFGVIAENPGTGGVVALTKIGTNFQGLAGANTYTGLTTVNEGELMVRPPAGGGPSIPRDVIVNAGGTFSGNGSVGGSVTVEGGTIAPGQIVGTLSVTGPMTFRNGAALQIQISGNDDTGVDHLVGSSTIDFLTTGSGSLIRIPSATGTFNPNAPHTYTIATAASGLLVNGSVANPVTGIGIDASAFASPGTFSLSRSADNLSLVLTFTPVPEPSAMLVLLAGTSGAGWWAQRRCRNRQKAAAN